MADTAVAPGTQIRADGHRYPIGSGPSASPTRTPNRAANPPENGQVPRWNEARQAFDWIDPTQFDDSDEAAAILAGAEFKHTVVVGANKDFATLADAFAAYPAGGVDFFVTSGTYATTGLLPPPRCTIELSSGAVLRLPDNAGGQNVLSIPLSSPDVTIRGGKIDGNKAAQGASLGNGIAMFGPRQQVEGVRVVNANGYGIVGFAGADDMAVRGCVVEDSFKEGIEAQACSRVVIVGNRVLRSGLTGIYVWAITAQGGVCKDVTVTGNVVSAPGSVGAATGIRVDDGAENVTIAGNVVNNAGTANSYGIGAFSSTSAPVVNVAIAGNVVTGANFAAGIYATKATGVAIAGNAVSGTVVGINVQATVTEVSLADNIVRSCTQQGIYCAAANDSTISGNNVKSCGGTTFVGIEANAVTDCSITGNTVISSGTQGILVTNGAISWTVIGNVCALNRRDGIFANAGNGVVNGNICRANGQSANGYAGVLLGGANIAAAGNRCYDNQGVKTQSFGLKVGAVDGVVLGANALAGNLTSSLSVDVAATNLQTPRVNFGPRSVDPRLNSGSGAVSASRVYYLRAEGSGVISSVQVDVGALVSAGVDRIDVGVYANSGVGRAARPAARKASSGSTVIAGTGSQPIALTAPVYVEEGDWLAFVCDAATTLQLVGPNGGSSTQGAGLCHFQTATFPLPATAAPSSTNALYSWIIVGV